MCYKLCVIFKHISFISQIPQKTIKKGKGTCPAVLPMIQYEIVREKERTFIFAKERDFTSQIEVDTSLFAPETLLAFLRENDVRPEHLQNVYDDLLYQQQRQLKSNFLE